LKAFKRYWSQAIKVCLIHRVRTSDLKERDLRIAVGGMVGIAWIRTESANYSIDNFFNCIFNIILTYQGLSVWPSSSQSEKLVLYILLPTFVVIGLQNHYTKMEVRTGLV
jgi:hypothetical protein